MSHLISYSTFWVGGIYFAVPTAEVVELTKGLSVTPVPLGPPGLAGFINLRGQVVAGIDLRKRLQMEDQRSEDQTLTLFFRVESFLYGLLVDEVSDILELDDSTFEFAPSNLPAEARDLIAGVHKLSNRLLLVLIPDRIISGMDLLCPA